ncbi:hypothetical protein LTR85_012051 [Meristemomyces frigidus]|nr:hypothetical protein LTR85_012051 [Meristemomyces frigidus]
MTDSMDPTSHVKAESSSAHILRLPNELLDHVAESVDDTTDLLSLRLAGNSRLSKAALESTQWRLTTIYIEQSHASLARFLEVCRSPTHARRITEVRYLAAIRSLSPKELETNSEFRKVVKQLDAPESVEKDVLAIYEFEWSEQKELSEADGLTAALKKGLTLLPNIKSISLAGRPNITEGSVSDYYPFGGEIPAAYNRLRRWEYASERFFESEEGEQLQPSGSLRDHLCNVAHFGGFPRSVDNPRAIVEALAALDDQPWLGQLHMNFEAMPATAFDEEWGEYMVKYRGAVERALRHVHTFILQESLANEDRHRAVLPHEVQLEAACKQRWQQLLSAAGQVRTLAVQRNTWNDYVLFVAIVRTHSYPGLEVIGFSSNMCHDHNQELETPDKCYSAQAMCGFLLRHRQTLKAVYLDRASGDGPADVGLKEILRIMRYELPHLEFARIAEMLSVYYDDDLDPLKRHMTPYANLAPHARDRAGEEDSDIGRLARQCGIVAKEWEYQPHMGDADDPNDHRPPLGNEPVAIRFDYDFGPYVLRSTSKS